MTYLDGMLRERLDHKLSVLNSYRPLPQSAVKKIAEQFQVEMTYHSNAIEGNSLTLKETYLVINEGITIKGKPLKDHLEAKGHKEALEYLYELIERGKHHTVSEHMIRSLHQLAMQDIDREWAGRYRSSLVIIVGADHKPPEAIEVPGLMRELITWIRKNEKKLHPVESAALVHHRLVAIHPFFDGNGRAARLIMNVLLLRAGFPLSIVLKNDRKKYYRVLADADKGEPRPMVRFIARAVERSLDIYLKLLASKDKPHEKFITLSQLSKASPYSAKYLNLLARTGKLEAHKEGKNWLSSKEALKRYVQGRKRKR